MYYKELLSTYPKVVEVIQSCRTIPQYNSAIKYTKLYLKQLPALFDKELRPKLIQICNKQKFLIKYRYGNSKKKENDKERNRRG